MSSKGYGPIADGIGVAFWIIAALIFSGIGGIIIAVASVFVAGIFL